MFETYNFPDGKNDDRWYHWCIENWGTKWDACDKSIDYEDDEILALTFNTAWSPPEGIVEKLREKYPELTFSTAWSPPEGIMQELKDKYPDLGFTCFYDEPGMEIAGYY